MRGREETLTEGWTHYQRLGVGEEASQEEIRGAHRRLVRDLHPDGKSEAYRHHFDELMAAANTAADVLLNEEKRRSYDRELAAQRAAASHPESASEPYPPSESWRHRSDRSRGSGSDGSSRSATAGGWEGPAQEYAAERECEERARRRRESAVAGELGLVGRLVCGLPEPLHRAAIYALCGLGWLALLWAAVEMPYRTTGSPGSVLTLVAIAATAAVPFAAHALRKRWMRRTTRVFSMQPHYWPGIAPFNRGWFARTTLEGAIVGPLWALGAALAPLGLGTLALWTLVACSAAGVVLAGGWAFTLLRPEGRAESEG